MLHDIRFNFFALKLRAGKTNVTDQWLYFKGFMGATSKPWIALEAWLYIMTVF